MLVPRSFKYSSSPLRESSGQRKSTTKSQNIPASPPRLDQPRLCTLPSPQAPWTLTSAMPATPQPSKPVEIPVRRSHGDYVSQRTTRSRSNGSRKSRDTEKKHRPDALPPAVAALLAVTAIPPPRSQPRPRKNPVRDISIDELVQEWRKDTSAKSSYSCTPLDMLLGSTDEDDYETMYSSRSTSCDSIPSLDADDGSMLSVSNPATPDSVRSRKLSTASYRKEKSFLTPESKACGYDHPLGLPSIDFDEDLIFVSPSPKERRQRKSSSFRSNLSSSLQAIKSRVTSSISSLNFKLDDDSFSDASLWQHPYLFPRLSSEMRPTPFTSTPSRSQRQYFNPRSAPVPFEEQQHHWQKALASSDDLPDHEGFEAPMIQMQTYKRATSSPRRSRRGSSTNGPDPRSEAGRAMSGHVPTPSRQREPRENSDFLRVIVLEMNMRRGGKFEEGMAGRARIWLPPRKQPVARSSVFADEESEDEILPVGDGSRLAAKKIPRRWVGVSIE